MENNTSNGKFHIVSFFIKSKNTSLILFYFFLIYILGLTWNGSIILVVYFTTSLRTPLYLFLSNLSFVDICSLTVTIPKLMDILLSGNNEVTTKQCFTQLYFFLLFTSTEVALLTAMAYDRYMAICEPLHYQSVMSKETCFLISKSAWLYGSLNSLFFISMTLTVSWCGSKNIQQFYCDLKALLPISCNNVGLKVAIYIGILYDALFPFLISLISYVKIIKAILEISSKNDRKKAYSTCSSHLMVLLSFYGTSMCAYLIPSSQNLEELEQIFSLFYTTVTPVLNPLIYTLRNNEVKAALTQLVRMK